MFLAVAGVISVLLGFLGKLVDRVAFFDPPFPYPVSFALSLLLFYLGYSVFSYALKSSRLKKVKRHIWDIDPSVLSVPIVSAGIGLLVDSCSFFLYFYPLIYLLFVAYLTVEEGWLSSRKMETGYVEIITQRGERVVVSLKTYDTLVKRAERVKEALEKLLKEKKGG